MKFFNVFSVALIAAVASAAATPYDSNLVARTYGYDKCPKEYETCVKKCEKYKIACKLTYDDECPKFEKCKKECEKEKKKCEHKDEEEEEKKECKEKKKKCKSKCDGKDKKECYKKCDHKYKEC